MCSSHSTVFTMTIFSCRSQTVAALVTAFGLRTHLKIWKIFQTLAIPNGLQPSSFSFLQPFQSLLVVFQPFLAFFSLFYPLSLFSLQHFIAFFSLQSFLAFSLFQPLAFFSPQPYLAWAGSVGMNSMFSLVLVKNKYHSPNSHLKI